MSARKQPRIARSLIDWKKQDKLQFRNFNESVDFHDVVKCILMRMLRRKHPNRTRVPIYSEFAMTDEGIGDIWMRDEYGDIYVWEIQERITKKWNRMIVKRYEEVNLIIVPLRKMPKTIGLLTKRLKEYIV